MKMLLAVITALVPLLGAYAQYQIRGTVKDQSGDPLPSATVLLQNSEWATSTDGSGRFLLTDVSGGTYTLRVTYVGFEAYEQAITLAENIELDIRLTERVIRGEEVIVYATRAREETPMTFTNFSKTEIEDRNLGQDLPFVLGFTPNMVVTSDAGNGVGYTGMRIRGSDPTRINVTVNGVPLNDAESHGVFWVNMPDFASSVDNIQIQRGVGTSTNGAAAFGATVNLQTDVPASEPAARIDNSFGSFNTWKHTLEYTTGLINDRWAFEGRLSKISSDGYIDRAEADLRSYFVSAGYYGDHTTLKALHFAGKEVTYQSWWGTPQARLENDRAGMEEVIANNGYTDAQAENLLNSGRTFNYYLYENEVDNYQQDHYQLHLSQQLGDAWNANAALHYTYGRGYFEQYREGDDFANYGLPDLVLGDSTLTSTNLIRRRWLDNHFYGTTFSANYVGQTLDLTLGGGWNRYDGDHFGELIWMQYAGDAAIRDRYYDNVGKKTDFNGYVKGNYQLNDRLNLFADAQIRTVNYQTAGIDNDLRVLDIDADFAFFNPKAGLSYQLSKNTSLYASYAVSHREPVRNDFVDAPAGQVPRPERLNNLEVGYRKTTATYALSANYYLMHYRDQLVLTGELNDVGSSVRVNVPSSYRMGVELAGAWQPVEWLRWSANLALSRNKISRYTEVLYDYGTNFDEFNVVETEYTNTDISFSPAVVAGSQLTVKPLAPLSVSLLSKYVGRQYLDNTSNTDRSIDAYFVNDLKVDYQFALKGIRRITLSLLVNNLANVQYSSNGYTFGYAGGAYVVRENYYYPQAGIHFLSAVSLRF